MLFNLRKLCLQVWKRNKAVIIIIIIIFFDKRIYKESLLDILGRFISTFISKEIIFAIYLACFIVLGSCHRQIKVITF